ncbi:MAG TPA: transposase [Opitutus sp.]|nr:transposase [Opitutus sp.]
MSGIKPDLHGADHPSWALHVVRSSQAGANYFVTGCLQRPSTGLTSVAIAGALQAKPHALDLSGHWRLRTFVIMPDHFHLLFILGEAASLSTVLRRFKGPLTPVLRAHRLRWQENFYDHRLHAGEELLPVFLYIFLNPYRAGLAPADQKWPGYFCAADDWDWFGGLTNSAVPFPEWLM